MLLLSRGAVICCCVFVRLSRAATAYKRLSADDQSTYDNITAAPKKRIEPECHKELYTLLGSSIGRARIERRLERI